MPVELARLEAAAFAAVAGEPARVAVHQVAHQLEVAALVGRAGNDDLRLEQAIEAEPDDSISAVRQKEADWERVTRSPQFLGAWREADAWCAAFLWPKRPDLEHAAVTEDVWQRIRRDPSDAPQATRRIVRELAKQHRFFHWHLAFPQVFGESKEEFKEDDTTGWTGGFDVVLGNPPWERIKLQEKEFFASRAPDISTAENASARKKAIARLETENPELWVDWQAALRQAGGESALVRDTGRYPLCGRGDVNTTLPLRMWRSRWGNGISIPWSRNFLLIA